MPQFPSPDHRQAGEVIGCVIISTHRATLRTNVTRARGSRPIGRVTFRDDCSCGKGDEQWHSTAGLAHAAHDAHVAEVAAR